MIARCNTPEDGCTRTDRDGWSYEYWADEDGEHKGKRVRRVARPSLPQNTFRDTGIRSNRAEQGFETIAKDNNWETSKRGWPDFIVFPEGPGGGAEPFVVEVKPRTAEGKLKALKREQIRVLSWLQSKGIRCYVSDGETLEPYEEWRHL